MSFQSNNKLGRGGARPGAGRPTREEAEFKARVIAAVDKELEYRTAALAKRYIDQAFVDNKVLMHLIDRCIPPAKQEVGVSGGVKIVRIIAPKYD